MKHFSHSFVWYKRVKYKPLFPSLFSQLINIFISSTIILVILSLDKFYWSSEKDIFIAGSQDFMPLSVYMTAYFHPANYFIAIYVLNIYRKRWLKEGKITCIYHTPIWLTASRFLNKVDTIRRLIKEIEVIMSKFYQLDLEDLQFGTSLLLIMSWIIKLNNRRKDTHQPTASKWLTEIRETQANGWFMKLFQ